jgi:hypothetical protein
MNESPICKKLIKGNIDNYGLGQGGNGLISIMVQFHTDPKLIKRSVIQLWQVTTTLINY